MNILPNVAALFDTVLTDTTHTKYLEKVSAKVIEVIEANLFIQDSLTPQEQFPVTISYREPPTGFTAFVLQNMKIRDTVVKSINFSPDATLAFPMEVKLHYCNGFLEYATVDDKFINQSYRFAQKEAGWQIVGFANLPATGFDYAPA